VSPGLRCPASTLEHPDRANDLDIWFAMYERTTALDLVGSPRSWRTFLACKRIT